MPPRPLPLALALALTSCEPSAAETTRPPEPVAAAPRLVVLVVIDQLPSWSFDGQRDALDGGIARLLRDGAYWPVAAYPYATTNTAPGHATIASGTTPSVHGIIANRWFDPAKGRRVEVDDDPQAKVIDPRDGHLGDAGVSNHRLLAPGIADALHAARPGARAVAIGWKSRAAVTVLGQHPDVALWFDAGSAAMASSTAFGAALPAWVTAFAKATPGLGEDGLGEPWTPLDPPRIEGLAGRPDAAPDEGDPYGLGSVFPHRTAATKTPAKALAFTPRANTLLVDTALAAIAGEHLGEDDVPDILAITFSPHDYAGHVWCQESWERVDHLLRIDRDLGRLFDTLDAKLGPDGWAAVLTSDHGALPSRERLREQGKATPFFATDDLEAAARDAAVGVLGPGDWVLGATTIELSMTAAFAARPQADRDRALDAVVAALRARGLAYVERIDHRPDRACEGDDVAALVCRSIHPAHSGDVYMVAPQWGLLNDEQGECTAHGSPWAYDREVPILVMAPGVAPGRRAEVPSMLQLAPTVAALLGVPPPARATAAPLR